MIQGWSTPSLIVSTCEGKVQELSTYSVQKVGPVRQSSVYSGSQKKQSLMPAKEGTCCKAKGQLAKRKTFLSPYPFIVSHQRVWSIYRSRSGLRVCLSSGLRSGLDLCVPVTPRFQLELDIPTTTEALLSMFACQFVPDKVRSGSKSNHEKCSLLLVLLGDPKFYSFNHGDRVDSVCQYLIFCLVGFSLQTVLILSFVEV